MNDMKFRECDEKDDPKIAVFLRRMLEEMANAGGYPPKSNDAFWQVLPLKVRGADHKCLVVEHDAELRGFVLAKVQPLADVFEPVRSLHITGIYVCPEYRGQGIAKRLLADVLEWGRAEGCQQADLNVLPGNDARHLYEGSGFKVSQHWMIREMEQ